MDTIDLQLLLNNELLEATKANNLEELEALINKGAQLDAKDKYGVTPLMFASFNGHIEIVAFLLKKDANKQLEAEDKYGKTALMFACAGDHLDIVDLLLKQNAGKQLEAEDKYGKTALIHASENNHLRIVLFLLQKNADTKRETKKNEMKTALILAYKKHHIDTAYLLLSKMTSQQYDELEVTGDCAASVICKNFKKNTLNIYRSINASWNLLSREKNILTSLPVDIISSIHKWVINSENFSPWCHHHVLNEMNTAINYFISDKKPPLPAIFSFNPNKRKARSEPEENRPHKKIALSEAETNMVIEKDNDQPRYSM